MKLSTDILILHSKSDDEANENSLGWVSNFKRFIKLILIHLLEFEPTITSQSEHEDLNEDDFQDTTILLLIITPEFVINNKNLEKIERFVSKNNESISKIFQVIKKPINENENNNYHVLSNLVEYNLFNYDKYSGEAVDITDFFSLDSEKFFWMKLVDLAYDIHDKLIELNNIKQKNNKKSNKISKTIYLAETGDDLKIQRNILKRELIRNGCNVLPKDRLPLEIEKFDEKVTKSLAESDFSIHLIGNNNGPNLKGTEISIVYQQNELATKRINGKNNNSNDFNRLIWLSNQLNDASETQLAFIESIKRDLASSDATEVLQTALEDFKNIIREELIETKKQLSLENNHHPSDKILVYLIYDKIDATKAEKIKIKIEEAGFNVLTPSFKNDLLSVRSHHINNLIYFDAAIIFQSKAQNQWIKMKLLDLLKAPGFGRKKRIIGKAIMFENENLESDLANYQTKDLNFINNHDDSANDMLSNFLKELNHS